MAKIIVRLLGIHIRYGVHENIFQEYIEKKEFKDAIFKV